ncbi:MAG: LTA synthase family protein [Clostridia bacterium]|nr:LTA synthase family protein [Clostridia bacterium]
MTEPDKKIHRRRILATVILLLGNILFYLTLFLLSKYDKFSFDQFLFQLKSSSEGVHRSLAGSAAVRVGLFSVVTTACECLLYLFVSGDLKNRVIHKEKYDAYATSKFSQFFSNRSLGLSIVVLITCLTIFISQLNVVTYVDTVSTPSDFIEGHYVDPGTANITFPKQKRNLIYIFLESMENTFADPAAGGLITKNFIPELSQLAEDHINFSHTDGVGGAYSFNGTTWTASAMVAQTSGMPVKVSLVAQDVYGADEVFLPGVVSIGEILRKQGYQQTLLVGSDAKFHGREPYFTLHGAYDIVDTVSLKEEGRLPKDYSEWWGFEDEKLFSFAKEELTRLAASDEPFNLTMLTADTHFPDGYTCRLCKEEHERQYANVLSCSSRQVMEFIKWIQAQSFYENTTIIISGDHLSMDSAFLDDVNETYTRTVYNCIIHSAVTPQKEKNREFSTMDMYPTTLAAIGATIEGERLALGTNLFSKEPTLTEQYGYQALDVELQKKSEFYNTRFLGMEE